MIQCSFLIQVVEIKMVIMIHMEMQYFWNFVWLVHRTMCAPSHFPKVVPLLSAIEKLICRINHNYASSTKHSKQHAKSSLVFVLSILLSVLSILRSRLPSQAGNNWTFCRGEWPSGLRHGKCVRRIHVSTHLGARPGVRTQSFYEAPSDLQVIIRIKYLAINTELVKLSPCQ